jgi:membrane protein EpsK
MAKAKTRPESKQFALNVLANLIVTAVNILIGIWLTPYLINKLGVATYGIVILATSFTSYMSIFNSAIDNAVGRFLTLDIKKQRFRAANQTFNTAFWSSLVILLLLLPATAILAYFSPRLFDTPLGQEQSTRWLFGLVMGAYLLIILRSVFSASTFAHNRLDLQNGIFSSNTIVRTILIIIFFSLLLVPKAWHYGLATLTGATISLILAIAVWKYLTPQLSINRQDFERSRLRKIFSMSGWLIINQIGSLLFLNIDLIVVNTFLGAEVQGRYGSILQWVILLRTVAQSVSKALLPLIMGQFAQNELEKVGRTVRSSIKLMGLTMALPIGIVVGFADELLTLWLGPEFADMALILRVLVVHLCINLAVLPLFSLQVVLNKIRWPGIVTLVLGLLNVGLAVSWVRIGNSGLGVALAGSLVLTLKNTLFIPVYGAKIQNLPWYTFLKNLIPGVVSTSGVILVVFFLTRYVIFDSWLTLISVCILLAITYSFLLYFLMLNESERRILMTLIRRN